jgi:hypothetical protein
VRARRGFELRKSTAGRRPFNCDLLVQSFQRHHGFTIKKWLASPDKPKSRIRFPFHRRLASALPEADAEQQFEARLEGELLCLSRTPFLAAARALLKKGHPPATEIAMIHAGSDVVALRARLGDAARLTVREDQKGARFATYRPPGAGASASTGFGGLRAIDQPRKANARPGPHPGTIARKTVRRAA